MTTERLTNTDDVLLGIDPGTNLLGYGVIQVTRGKAQLKALGVIDLRKVGDSYAKLGRIFERVSGLIASFHPSEMAIESPFYGKNVQSMLKLGRAQGVAIAAAMEGGLTVHEYAPRKIKMALTGNGNASKEQVASMLQKILKINSESMVPYLDATDALAAAYCHFMQRGIKMESAGYHDWKDFVKKNTSRVSRPAISPKEK
jgi:crossover junction endodeoxyribonuclease RuvC